MYIIAHTVLLGSYNYTHVGCWLPSSYVQFALLDISRQLVRMKLGSSRNYQPMQYCWVHTSQLLGYLVYTCHFPIDIQQIYCSTQTGQHLQCSCCPVWVLQRIHIVEELSCLGVYCIFVYRKIIYLVSCYITVVIKLHPNPGLILTVL